MTTRRYQRYGTDCIHCNSRLLRNKPPSNTTKEVLKVTLIYGFILFLPQVIFLLKFLITLSKGELSAKVIFHVSQRMAGSWTVAPASACGLFTDRSGMWLCADAEPEYDSVGHWQL